MIIFIFSKIIIMDIPRNYHLEDKVEYIIALVNEERMIRLSGVKGIEIRFTGLRDGEKLYEEVLNEEEPSRSPKSVRMIMRTPICGLMPWYVLVPWRGICRS